MWTPRDKSGRTRRSSYVIGEDDQIIQGMADLEFGMQQQGDLGYPSSHRHRHHRRSHVQQVESKEESKARTPHASRSSTANSFGASATADLPKDLERDIVNLRKFYAKYRSVVCHKCRAPLGTTVDVARHVRRWSRGISATAGPVKEPRVGANVKKTEHGVLDWCCSQGRLFAIWLFAAKYDEVHLQTEIMTARKSRHSGADRSNQDSRAMAKGVGYAEGVQSWDDDPWEPIYDDVRGLRGGATATKAIDFQQADSVTDDVLERILFFVRELLPDTAGKTTFDQDPPCTIRAFLQLGLLLDKLAELLRNDSINDLSARASLYFAVFEFVRRLASHWGTSNLVTAQRYSKKHTKGLQLIAGAEEAPGRSGSSRAKNADEHPLSVSGAGSSLASLVQGLVKQSIIILSSPNEFGGRSGQKTLDLCTEVNMLNATIMSLAPDDEAKGKGKGKGKDRADTQLGSGAVADKWAAWHREHGLEQTSQIPGKRFYYFEELSRLRRSPKGRIPRLIKEIAEMSTGLPPGIFVRASLERPDAMKCMIIGPDDTPYAGGLFE
ncbi:hypothetical protein GP486_006241 [Trichoglossum hirsutum]|uniref:UBC core domain-containing protein n=1 Tax=Trichoglossum hirsutum TaxID=265104 RepID=A0A9P8L7U7_9PEZI|nr:hypothetical protein GP486_006241 [Trichoglossum hirsutum]